MRESASAHGGADQAVPAELAPVSVGACAGRDPMTNQENQPTELEEPFEKRRQDTQACDGRYADFTTEAGYVVYDRDNATAWIESDTTVDIRELV